MIIEDHEYLDFSRVPESRGIPPVIRTGMVIGIICIFIIGGLVAFLSGHGHLWPSLTTTRMPLGNLPSGL
jgi:hypothetical protein